MQLDVRMQAEQTQLAQMLTVPAIAYKGHVHAKKISVTGNNADSLHTTQFFIQACLFYTSSRIYVHRFNAVAYQPTLYLFVAVSISCMTMPCWKSTINKEQG